NNTLQRARGMAIFRRKVPLIVSPSIAEHLVDGISLKPLELYLDSIQGEHRVLHRFAFKTISTATENFSAANKMSQHRYGSMYKGKLQNDQGIAVSRPYLVSECQGYISELSLLVNSQHENLIQLLGYCIHGTTMFIVYDFAPYASLDRLIFDPMSNLLDWNERYKVIVGVARVLVYLHKHAPIQIIHGNVKPGNILLDESLDPKLAYIGFARYLAGNRTDSVNADLILQTS
ncbi:kinase RLK-Pelle-CrRLK1L-1 family protein, partial [Tanacetum coccineum]